MDNYQYENLYGKNAYTNYKDSIDIKETYTDKDGNPIYYEYTGGGSVDTAQYKIRVLYINYYEYLYGAEPNYIMGTDAQGRDLMLRLAGGIRLSLLIAIVVSGIIITLASMIVARRESEKQLLASVKHLIRM